MPFAYNLLSSTGFLEPKHYLYSCAGDGLLLVFDPTLPYEKPLSMNEAILNGNPHLVSEFGKGVLEAFSC